MSQDLARALQDAIASGLIEAPPNDTGEASRPWPVVIMTALMTALAAIPLCGVLVMLFLEHAQGWQTVVVGSVTLACAIGMLAVRPTALFLEYAAAAFVASSLILLYFNPFHTGPELLPGLVAVASSCLVPQRWIRALLAAAAVWLLGRGFDGNMQYITSFIPWPAWYGSCFAWLTAHVLLQQTERTGNYHLADIIESILIGSGLMIILMLTYSSGPTFLLSGSVFFHAWMDGGTGLGNFLILPPVISVCAAAGSCLWLAGKANASYRPWLLFATVPVSVLSYFALPLGAIILVGTANFLFYRKHLALVSCLAGLWTVGSLYYRLDWPLLYKAFLLFGTGVTLVFSNRLLNRESQGNPISAVDMLPTRWKQWALVVPVSVIVIAINVKIWNNELLIRQGTTIFVELEPVDPRSLMQGDYMRLRFVLPAEVEDSTQASGLAVAKRGANGVAVVTHWRVGIDKPKPDEVLIKVVRRGDRNVLVTDAWYFKEGDGSRWSSAKYGEFHIDNQGKAILVGLRGPALETISEDAPGAGERVAKWWQANFD